MIQTALFIGKKILEKSFLFSRKTIENTRKRRFTENFISSQNLQDVCNTQREREIIIQKKSQQKKGQTTAGELTSSKNFSKAHFERFSSYHIL